MIRPGSLAVVVCTGVAIAAMVGVRPAVALDLLGLFGFGDKTPEPTATSFPFTVATETGDAPSAVGRAIENASTLYGLRNEALPAAETLVRIALADLPKMTDALWGLGYYEARVTVTVAGQTLALGRSDEAAAIRAAQALRGKAAVPVVLRADPGPQFVLRRVDVTDPQGRAFPPAELPPRVIGLPAGNPASSGAVTAAQSRIVDHFRELGHPFAKVTRLSPVVDHPARAMDVTLVVAPGPVAGIGAIGISGLETVDEAPVRSFIYTEPGDPYAPSRLAAMRKSVARIPALASVRVREAEQLDKDGNLPLFVEVTERKPRTIGAAAQFSTRDGPELRGYWMHRNLFGGAESLRLEGSLFYAATDYGTQSRSLKDFTLADLGGRFTAAFVKPGLGGTRNDLLANAIAARDRALSYTARYAGGDVQLRHRFTDAASIQAGIRFERGQVEDILSRVDYTLVGLPISATYDSTNRPLDPTSGFRATATVTPYPAALGSTVAMTIGRATLSAYWAVDEDERIVLAGRVGAGSIAGPALPDIPANYRFYAGGSTSVRGYAYQSLAPYYRGVPVGGRSLLEGSLEARIKVTDEIGIVPFVDAGNAFARRLPDLGEGSNLKVGVGMGLRYYTPIGPIRLDVATPLDRDVPRTRPVAVYIGIGQAF